PIKPEPAQRVGDLRVTLFAVACRVGVFDPKHEGAPGVARVRPIKQGRTHHAHVRRAGWRWAEADAEIAAGRGRELGCTGVRHRLSVYSVRDETCTSRRGLLRTPSCTEAATPNARSTPVVSAKKEKSPIANATPESAPATAPAALIVVSERP